VGGLQCPEHLLEGGARRTKHEQGPVIFFGKSEECGSVSPRALTFRLRKIVAALMLALIATPPLYAAPAFTTDAELSSDTGYVGLSWEGGKQVILEIANAPDFSDAKLLYEGVGDAYFLSGLRDGEYHLRLRESGGATSEPVLLTVAHQSLEQAIWLTIIGAIITLVILTVIFRGARDD